MVFNLFPCRLLCMFSFSLFPFQFSDFQINLLSFVSSSLFRRGFVSSRKCSALDCFLEESVASSIMTRQPSESSVRPRLRHPALSLVVVPAPVRSVGAPCRHPCNSHPFLVYFENLLCSMTLQTRILSVTNGVVRQFFIYLLPR